MVCVPCHRLLTCPGKLETKDPGNTIGYKEGKIMDGWIKLSASSLREDILCPYATNYIYFLVNHQADQF